MRNKILLTATAAFVLSTVAMAPYLASAQPSPAQMKRAGETKDPVAADAKIAKYEAKDAKKQAHKARKKAKIAHHKAKVAAKKADEADKAADAPH